MGPCFRRDDGRGFNCQTADTTSPSRREAPEALHLSLAPNRGRGECRVPAAPAASCALVESTRVFTTGPPEHPAFPHAMVLTVSFVLSPATGLVCHRYPRIWQSLPGRADFASANLTPASGRQDHTTSPSAATSLVRTFCDHSRIQRTRPAIPSRAKRCRVHRIPPRVRDDHDTPLCGVGREKL